MFEHVGRGGREEYFAHAFRLLAPGGLFLNHAISNRPQAPKSAAARALEERFIGSYHFRTRYIFPDGELMPVSRLSPGRTPTARLDRTSASHPPWFAWRQAAATPEPSSSNPNS